MNENKPFILLVCTEHIPWEDGHRGKVAAFQFQSHSNSVDLVWTKGGVLNGFDGTIRIP